jgi:hypothetical protein
MINIRAVTLCFSVRYKLKNRAKRSKIQVGIDLKQEDLAIKTVTGALYRGRVVKKG